MQSQVRYEARIIYSLDDISHAIHQTGELAEGLSFDSSEVTFLRLCTEEACMNALEHGGGERGHPFKIKWAIFPRALTISLIQQGKPYELCDVQAINKGMRGRGLILIMNLMDRVSLKKRHNFVILRMQKIREDSKDVN